MALVRPAARHLEPIEGPMPVLGRGQVRLRVHACGVCRTDLHIVDGELETTAFPRIPGHEIVGSVVEVGPGCMHARLGDRLGVPWLHGTCEACRWCGSGRENLCPGAVFTGWSVDGGYAQAASRARWC